MALISCPECGRTNVSDTAECCPNCGYAVNGYVEQEKQKVIQNEKIQSERKKLQSKLEAELKKIDKMSYPKEPSFSQVFWKEHGGLLIIFGITGIFSLSVGIFHDGLFFAIQGIIFLLIVLGGIIVISDAYKNACNTYKHRTEDWEGYKNKCKEDIIKKYEEYFNNLANYDNKIKPISNPTVQITNVPKCPVCGSTKVKKISLTKNAVSGLQRIVLRSKTDAMRSERTDL